MDARAALVGKTGFAQRLWTSSRCDDVVVLKVSWKPESVTVTHWLAMHEKMHMLRKARKTQTAFSRTAAHERLGPARAPRTVREEEP